LTDHPDSLEDEQQSQCHLQHTTNAILLRCHLIPLQRFKYI